MTLIAADYIYGRAETPLEKAAAAPAAAIVAGSPYGAISRAALHLDDVNFWSHAARVNQSHHAYMVRRGMPISSAAARNFAFTSGQFVPMARSGRFPVRILRKRGLVFAAKLAGRAVPGLGWALLAYDLYTIGNKYM